MTRCHDRCMLTRVVGLAQVMLLHELSQRGHAAVQLLRRLGSACPCRRLPAALRQHVHCSQLGWGLRDDVQLKRKDSAHGTLLVGVRKDRGCTVLHGVTSTSCKALLFAKSCRSFSRFYFVYNVRCTGEHESLCMATSQLCTRGMCSQANSTALEL